MNQRLFLATFPPLINLFTITITSFLLLRRTISIDDPQFLACNNSKTCGDGLNITFPFYIENEQKNYCGYPGFNVSCRSGRTVLRLQGRNYIIHQISYETHTVRVSNTPSFNTTNTCVPPFQNSSLWRNEKFKLYSNQTELILLYNCNSSEIGGGNNSELMKYKLNCSSDDSNSTLSMFKDDPLLGRASGVCENAVVTDVDVDRGGGDQIQSSTEIQLMMERGFLLNWTASNCSICQNSGGKCGFDFDIVHFRCFCPDRPHAWHCVHANVESVLSAAESKYESCKPRSCGSGPNISYPFYVYGNETDYCGHPGFRVHCSDHRPIYKTSAADYIIQNISYESQSFRVVDLEVFNYTTCPTPQQNYSFDRSSVDFSPYHADILFFYNCTDSISINYTVSRVTCNTSVINEIYIALVPRDEHFNWNRTACEFIVGAPVQLSQWEINQTITNIDYRKKLSDGFTLKWIGLGYNCADCQLSGGICGFEEESNVCYCPDGTHPKHCKDGNNRLALKLGIGAGLAVLVIILLACVVLHRYIRRHGSSNLTSTISSSDLSSKLEIEVGFGIPVFSYAELEKATRNFDSEKELGDGGYGTVYYGKLKDGREVAVKRLYEHNCRRVEQFLNEIKILTRLRHRNLVSLYGCTSRRSRELLLVYEYIPNGTVADHLHGNLADSSPLTWPIRMSIAIETASALAYLHASDIIHRDVKTNNILLDNGFCVKVADFGLSRLFPNDVTHVSTAPQGTPGYVDPEYHQCYQLTDKSDVYSFGVVLIELISSMPAVDISRQRSEINLANLAVNRVQNCEFEELIDPCFWYKSNYEVRRMAIAVAELGFRCLQQDKEMRPTMDDVLEELKAIEEGEHNENKEEVQAANVLPPPSPPDCIESSLLKNIILPASPDTVTAKWNSSCSTTSNISS